MKYIDYYKINNSGVLGTTVGLQILFNEEPTSVVVSVYDAGNAEVVDNASATGSDLGRFFSYDYQSSTSGLYGWYRFIVDYVINDLTYKACFNFLLEDKETYPYGW